MKSLKNNKIKNLIILLVTIFILLFFTKQAFYNMNQLLDENKKDTDNLSSIVNQLNELQTLEQDLKKWDKADKIKYFSSSINRADLIEYFHNYAEDISDWGNELFIHSINFSKPIKWELWFMEQNINLNVTVSNKDVLKALLTQLTSNNSKYKFFITNFSFPNDNRVWAYTVDIPLKLLYK